MYCATCDVTISAKKAPKRFVHKWLFAPLVLVLFIIVAVVLYNIDVLSSDAAAGIGVVAGIVLALINIDGNPDFTEAHYCPDCLQFLLVKKPDKRPDFCEHCGREHNAAAKFCGDCGKEIHAE